MPKPMNKKKNNLSRTRSDITPPFWYCSDLLPCDFFFRYIWKNSCKDGDLRHEITGTVIIINMLEDLSRNGVSCVF